jgi:hypothetical protein
LVGGVALHESLSNMGLILILDTEYGKLRRSVRVGASKVRQRERSLLDAWLGTPLAPPGVPRSTSSERKLLAAPPPANRPALEGGKHGVREVRSATWPQPGSCSRGARHASGADATRLPTNPPQVQTVASKTDSHELRRDVGLRWSHVRHLYLLRQRHGRRRGGRTSRLASDPHLDVAHAAPAAPHHDRFGDRGVRRHDGHVLISCRGRPAARLP